MGYTKIKIFCLCSLLFPGRAKDLSAPQYFLYLFQTKVNHTAYSNMLQTWFAPQLGDRDLQATTFAQQDGGYAHYTFPIGGNFDDTIRGRWIGRATAMVRLPRNLCLITCNNYL